MKYQRTINILVPLIFFLALVAAGAGLFANGGSQPYTITNFRGEPVTINARGLYYWDTVNSAAQMQGNDIVTLVVGLPLLAFSFWLARRGSLRGRLLLTGTLGFFFYTYMSMCFGTAYNKLFLVYVALFGLSLYALVLSLMSFDVQVLPQYFSARLPRRRIAGLFLFSASFLLMAWLGRIAPTLLQDQQPALDNVTSMFIQAMDLALIVPLCILSAVLLLRRSAWGYLIASVASMKFLTMGLALSAMVFNMIRAGTVSSMMEVVMFPLITLLNLWLAAALLRSIQQSPAKA